MSFTNIYSTKANVAYDPYSVIIGNGTSGSILQTTSTNAVWQSTGTYSITADPWNSSKNPVKLTSKGMELPEDGDVTFGNVSLKKTLESIESRLAILRPDPQLEADWEELRRLGDAYRSLEKEIREKMGVWDTLKRVDE